MSVIYIVLPLAFILAGIAVWAFIWMVKDGQLDDLDSPQIRILFDDAPAKARPAPRVVLGPVHPVPAAQPSHTASTAPDLTRP
ncbi:MAG: cbb3-type cytochrome oxidase assembly protein CcoS [Phycisphaerales bacterium]